MSGFQNVSSLNILEKWQVSMFSKLYTGAFQNNNLSLCTGSYRFDRSKASHILGLNLYLDKEGSYIKRQRAYALYTYALKISHTWQGRLGIALGGINHKLGNDGYDFGGQDNAPDGQMGLTFCNNSTTLGISIMQLFNSTVQPLEEINEFRRYASFHGSKSIQINQTLDMSLSLSSLLYYDRHNVHILGTGLKYQNMISIAALHKWKQSVGIMFGIENIKLGDEQLKFYISYDFNISKSYKNNSAELTLKYCLPNEMVTKKKRKL